MNNAITNGFHVRHCQYQPREITSYNRLAENSVPKKIYVVSSWL